MDEPEARLTRTEAFRKANAPGLSWLLIVVVLLLLAAAVMIFGQGQQQLAGQIPTSSATITPESSDQPRIYTVSFDAGVFSPTNLRIHAGDTVKFKNESIFPIHIKSEDLAGFDSTGDIPQGSYFSYTFAARGTFSYHDSRNADQAGTIIVR